MALKIKTVEAAKDIFCFSFRLMNGRTNNQMAPQKAYGKLGKPARKNSEQQEKIILNSSKS
jgi:hypothetical protein